MDYPANSHKSEDEKENKTPGLKIEKDLKPRTENVTSSPVQRRKKSLGHKFKELFVGGEGRSVLSYVFLDVVVPAAKDLIVDAASQGIERMFYGDSAPRGRGRKNTGYVSYSGYSSTASRHPGHPNQSRDPREETRPISKQSRAAHNFDEIIIGSRGEAEEVLDRLYDALSQYGSVSVADLYGLTDITPSYVDYKWGWTNLRGSNISRVRQGYLLDLPRTEPLD